MSGMFQRIARRNADRPDEPGAAEPAGDAAEAATSAPVTPDAAAPDAPTTVTPPIAAGDAAPDAPTTVTPPVMAEEAAPDAPTERIDPVTPAPVPPPAAAVEGAPPAPETALTVPAPAPEATSGEAAPQEAPRRAGFRARGRMRRRLRYLRKLREIQVRDLGGLVFDLRRFERKRDDLVAQKLDHIRACDDELHALENALDERRELRDVREPGIGGTCPRCFAVFGSADRFCSNCGAALGGAVQGPAQVPTAPAQPSGDAQS